MKKLALLAAAFTLLSVSAHAESYTFGKNRVVVPSGCSSWSCISVSVPGHYSHNVKPERKVQSSHKVATSSSTTTAATAPAQTNTAATAPSTSNVTVLPAPAATATKY